MTPARASLLLLTAIAPLAVAACGTVKKPLRGYDHQPAGTLALDDDSGASVVVWPIFDLPETDQVFRPRLNGQDIVYLTDEKGFYDYATWQMQGWTGGWSSPIRGMKPDTYVVELVDAAGQTWGKSAPIAVPGNANPYNPSGQIPAVIFAHFGDKVASWTVDPSTQDADTTTDEITVTNLADADVVVQRCLIAANQNPSCTSVGNVAAGADLRTVEKMLSVGVTDEHQILRISLASDPSQSFDRDLILGTGNINFGGTCQVERIIVHGKRMLTYYGTQSGTAFAMSSCYGYSGPS